MSTDLHPTHASQHSQHIYLVLRLLTNSCWEFNLASRFTNWQLWLRIRLCIFPILTWCPFYSSQVTSTTLRIPLLNLQASMCKFLGSWSPSSWSGGHPCAAFDTQKRLASSWPRFSHLVQGTKRSPAPALGERGFALHMASGTKLYVMNLLHFEQLEGT